MPDKQEMLAMYAVLYPRDNKGGRRNYRLRHFVITDMGNDHLPWDFIVDHQLFLEQVAGGSFFPFDFIRLETMDVYLTDNLWTCACMTGPYIHTFDRTHCARCNTRTEGIQVRGRTIGNTYRYWSWIIASMRNGVDFQRNHKIP